MHRVALGARHPLAISSLSSPVWRYYSLGDVTLVAIRCPKSAVPLALCQADLALTRRIRVTSPALLPWRCYFCPCLSWPRKFIFPLITFSEFSFFTLPASSRGDLCAIVFREREDSPNP